MSVLKSQKFVPWELAVTLKEALHVYVQMASLCPLREGGAKVSALENCRLSLFCVYFGGFVF